MGRITVLLVFIFVVVIAVVIADENEVCSETKECQCGSICNAGVCTKGCQLFDWFMAAGSEAIVYGRMCTCGDIPDKRGMLIECEEGVEFTGAPEGVAEWENNPVCEEPPPPPPHAI